MSVWPPSLPQAPLIAGHSEQPQDQTISTSMDKGPEKTRRRITAGYTSMPVQFVLTAAQVTTFESFWDSTIAAGALPFDFTHPRTGATVSVKASPAVYQLSPAGDNASYILSMVFQVQP